MSQLSFPPEILARIAPDISLQRHLSIGLRPNLRNFTEFRPIHVSHSAEPPTNSNVVSSTVVKCGNTTVINTVTVGIAEMDDSLQEFSSIYPVVEIHRGRFGEPIDEEQILSQQLHEIVFHSKLLPSAYLNVKCGLHVASELGNDRIYYPDIDPEQYALAANATGGMTSKKQVQYVLLVNCKVLSRQASMSSLFDLLYAGIVYTLHHIVLPRVYVELSLNTKVSIRSRASGKRSMIGTASTNFTLDMSLDNRILLYSTRTGKDCGIYADAGYSSNFGVVSLLNQKEPTCVLLCDVEGEAEESSVLLRISIVANKEKILRKVSLVADFASPISLDCLKNAIKIAQIRSNDLCTRNE